MYTWGQNFTLILPKKPFLYQFLAAISSRVSDLTLIVFFCSLTCPFGFSSSMTGALKSKSKSISRFVSLSVKKFKKCLRYFYLKKIKLTEYNYTSIQQNAYSKTDILRTTHDSDLTWPRANYTQSLWIDFSHICSVSIQFDGRIMCYLVKIMGSCAA